MLEETITPSISKILMEQEVGNINTVNSHSEKIAIEALAKGNYYIAETYLLGRLATANARVTGDQLWLLSQIYNRQHMPHSSKSLIIRLAKRESATDERLAHLILQTARLKRKQTTCPISLSAYTYGYFPHLDIEISTHYLWRGDINNAEKALENSKARDTCEGVLQDAKIHHRKGNPRQAERLLLKNWPRYNHRLDYALNLIEILFEMRRGDICLPIIKEALRIQGCYGSPLLEWLSKAKSLQREPAIALRLKLIERLPKIAGAKVSSTTALGCAYNDLGRSDWMLYLKENIANAIADNFNLHSNQLLQLSSITSPTYAKACNNINALLSEKVKQQIPRFIPLGHNEPREALRIGWVCGDINNHPVARFLYSWLASANQNSSNQHIVIATIQPDQHYQELFNNLTGIQFVDHSQTGPTAIAKVRKLRELNLDVAIDLNGWTGNNSSVEFIARIAPLQVNYLAYHASTGIEAMDVWIGDDNVFPQEENLEWHTERIIRLPRPFLAWEPQPGLPETKAKVTEISCQAESGIRYGTFNNLRKISDASLQCWGRILSAVPESKLALKAHNSTDRATATLIQRKLERNGITQDKIIWLPYTATPNEHLQQYQAMDVALDTFPNSGCTTTCEALWMGVPVITLQGQHYVSRMASAVMKGAGLPEWVCESVKQYEELAISQADPNRLNWLRENRRHWRQTLRKSPLGDAKDLMNQLDQTFNTLFKEFMHKQALNLTTDTKRLI